MLNKLCAFIRQQGLLQPGERVICAVSGGADSMALLWAMYLLKEKLSIDLGAAHFNHGLRGEESRRDEEFVRQFCQDYEIPFYCAAESVTAGEKGLEAAAREARYAFFQTLPGKIATAHTADDNAETVLMHLVRGAGLKGLGGIRPVNGKVIRPMLTVTREQVLTFLAEYSIPYVTDSSNETDDFLRNRLRHHVMPLLREENPRLGENLSQMALRLRLDEDCLRTEAKDRVDVLRQMHPARRARALTALLERGGVKEPEGAHVALAEKLVFSENPSAQASFPGGVKLRREYDRLTVTREQPPIEEVPLTCPGVTEIPRLGIRVVCENTPEVTEKQDAFSVSPKGQMVLRSRKSGDEMRLPGGTKSLKKLFIDRKIPATRRPFVAVIADEEGVLGVQGIGVNRDRLGPGVRIRFEKVDSSENCE